MTATFKGVAQEDVISSIREGMDFVASLGIGPETNAICAKWQEPEKFEPLHNAQNNDDLAKAMETTGATHAFAMLTKALAFHAERDTAGLGKRVFENIQKWEGDKGARMMMLTQTDMEISDHIASFGKFSTRIQGENRGSSQTR